MPASFAYTQTDHLIFIIKPTDNDPTDMDNTGVQLEYFKWLLDWRDIPNPPSKPIWP